MSLFSDPYNNLLNNVKQRIQTAQISAVLAVNQELILLYWHIGKEILERQQSEGWGAKVIDRLAKDLKQEFTERTGFSSRNLKYMRAFADAYPDESIVQRSIAQLPWRHNIALLEKLQLLEHRLWYAQQALNNGWSRDVLAMQIASGLHLRQGEAITNFDRTLPKPQSDLAQQLLKDPYNLSFLILEKNAQERDLEHALVTHIRDFLLELGVGFAFMGSQYRLEVEGDEFFIDLLFYHVTLRCYVAIDLKMSEFKPEYSGKMNFYVAAIDDLLRHSEDQPTIGIILCRDKKKTIAEYALRNVHTPIAITTHQLPSPEQLEQEMDAAVAAISHQASTF